MTHEYVIALGGRVRVSPRDDRVTPDATSIAWAADRVLAVGPDDDVSAISRGDSIFLDLEGSIVTAAPGGEPGDLEPGSPADLDFWDVDPADPRKHQRIVARVRSGSFIDGDEHCGPFRRISLSGQRPFDPEVRDDPH